MLNTAGYILSWRNCCPCVSANWRTSPIAIASALTRWEGLLAQHPSINASLSSWLSAVVTTQHLLPKVSLWREMSKFCKHYLLAVLFLTKSNCFRNYLCTNSAFALALGLTAKTFTSNWVHQNVKQLAYGGRIRQMREMHCRCMACTAFFPAARSSPCAMVFARSHVFGGTKRKTEISVRIMTLHSCATKDGLLAIRFAGFMHPVVSGVLLA